MKTHSIIHDPNCATIRDQRMDIDAGLAPCTCGAREKKRNGVTVHREGGYTALIDGMQSLGNGNYRRAPLRGG